MSAFIRDYNQQIADLFKEVPARRDPPAEAARRGSSEITSRSKAELAR
jgi:hypothetical protein